MDNILAQDLKLLFSRDLKKLKSELLAYSNESNLWIIDNEISNSGGNLCLHLVGNLNTFICEPFGNNGYIRKRDEEFSLKGVPRETMISMIDKTMSDISHALNQITPEQLQEKYPLPLKKEKTTVAFILLHLSSHLSYHLGQVNYHRRLMDGL